MDAAQGGSVLAHPVNGLAVGGAIEPMAVLVFIGDSVAWSLLAGRPLNTISVLGERSLSC